MFVSVNQGLATGSVLAHTAEALSLVAGVILVCAKQYVPKEILGIAEGPGTLPSRLSVWGEQGEGSGVWLYGREVRHVVGL